MEKEIFKTIVPLYDEEGNHIQYQASDKYAMLDSEVAKGLPIYQKDGDIIVFNTNPRFCGRVCDEGVMLTFNEFLYAAKALKKS